MISRTGIPSAISKLPGRCTLPETETIFVPVEFPSPYCLYHSAPRSMMIGALQSVSTLLISVGPW
jgi:hypothetical protein